MGNVLESMEQFTYLGCQMSSIEGSRSEQRHGVGLSASSMPQLHHVFQHITYLATLYALFPHDADLAGAPVCLRDMDHNDSGPCAPSGISHEVSATDNECAMAGPNPKCCCCQPHKRPSHWRSRTEVKALFRGTVRLSQETPCNRALCTKSRSVTELKCFIRMDTTQRSPRMMWTNQL